MKIATLTFHRAYNYGGVLQAYALQQALTGLGHDVDVLDYRCPTIEATYRLLQTRTPAALVKSVLRLPASVKKKKAFQAFRDQRLKVSPVKYLPSNLGAANDCYDAFVVGSDQVWNPGITGADGAYFLDFVSEGKIRVSYAASLGTMGLDESQERHVKANLGKFSAVSVREDSAVALVSEYAKTPVAQVLDPVFLLGADEWSALASTKARNPYVFAYSLHEEGVYSFAARIAEREGLDLVYVPFKRSLSFDGERVEGLAVEEFLGLIKDAAQVVTDSFHVSSFSLLFERQLSVFLKGGHGALAGMNGRLLSLLEVAGVSDERIVDSAAALDREPIDYARVREALEPEKSRAFEFLRGALCEPGDGRTTHGR